MTRGMSINSHRVKQNARPDMRFSKYSSFCSQNTSNSPNMLDLDPYHSIAKILSTLSKIGGEDVLSRII